MLELKPVSFDIKTELDEIFKTENSRSADFCFGNIYMWDKRFDQSVAAVGGRLITLLHRRGVKCFAFPVGSGDIRPAFEEMLAICRELGIPLRISGICDEHLPLIESAFPDCFSIAEDRDFSDYIYDIDALASYGGKHLHSKRNFCNRFEQENDWQFVPLTEKLIPACEEMLEKWNKEASGRLGSGISYEQDAISRCFAHFTKLGLEGGVLLSGGGVAGFTVGEMISSDTFCIHFEKAFSRIDGAYPMVCREMARLIKASRPEARYVNREDDMGLESLRKSKLSYKPEYILRKYTAAWIK